MSSGNRWDDELFLHTFPSILASWEWKVSSLPCRFGKKMAIFYTIFIPKGKVFSIFQATVESKDSWDPSSWFFSWCRWMVFWRAPEPRRNACWKYPFLGRRSHCQWFLIDDDTAWPWLNWDYYDSEMIGYYWTWFDMTWLLKCLLVCLYFPFVFFGWLLELLEFS